MDKKFNSFKQQQCSASTGYWVSYDSEEYETTTIIDISFCDVHISRSVSDDVYDVVVVNAYLLFFSDNNRIR